MPFEAAQTVVFVLLFFVGKIVEVILLCGGKSRRMGQDKASLTIQGETFLHRIVKNFSLEFPVILATGDGALGFEFGIRQAKDIFSGCGPLAGIHAAMGESIGIVRDKVLEGGRVLNADKCGDKTFFVVSCDMPFVTASLARFLEARLSPDFDAAIPVGGDSRAHPLSGVYNGRVFSAVCEALERGEYKAQNLLSRLNVNYVDLGKNRFLERQLFNVNTSSEYERIKDLCFTANNIPVLSFVAWSGTGKTTFLEKLVPNLKDLGLRVAVLKHDAHDFEIDVEGKDTFRMTKAGADVTAIVSAKKATVMENRAVEISEVLDKIRDVDVILLEGGKSQDFPKIMLHRVACGKKPLLEPSACLAVASDEELNGARYRFGLDDTRGVADFILRIVDLKL